MKSFITAALIVLSTTANANQNIDMNKYYQIDQVLVTEVTGLLPSDFDMNFSADDCAAVTPMAVNPFESTAIWIDQVVNLGQKIYKIVEEGKPVFAMNVQSSSAIPKGLTCWTQLSGWNTPQTQVFRVTYKNVYGMSVVDFTYRVGFVAGGSYQGKGKYVAQAQITPAAVDVLWGFNLNAVVEVPQVYNQGTPENPVAGIQLTLKWTVDTVLQHQERSEVFFVNGNNELTHLN